jgi:pimeloyl-ACP methyl ester carboxylesterase
VTELRAKANGIELAYETFGDPSARPLLMIMGLGAQMLWWDDDFCRLLAERGFYAVRFDNRDVGLSTRLSHVPPPSVRALLLRDTRRAAYTLDHMADDAVGLLDHLEIPAAHVVGASMGGMIAQTVAVRHPDRALSLTSIMSTTGGRKVGQARRRVLPVLLRRPPADRERYVEHAMRTFRLIGSSGFPRDEQRAREMIGRCYDRCYDPAGTGRQLLAIIASGDRSQALRKIDAPTLVIHGEDDPLIDVSGGKATAEAIRGSELMLIPGMGHDIPPQLWARIADAIAVNADRAPATTPVG